jgi:hypothetical protein
MFFEILFSNKLAPNYRINETLTLHYQSFSCHDKSCTHKKLSRNFRTDPHPFMPSPFEKSKYLIQLKI